MKNLTIIVLIGAFAALAGCSDTQHYPVSGQECGPNDPVRDLDAGNCLPSV